MPLRLFRALLIGVSSVALAAETLTPKLPLTADQRMKVTRDERTITVAGETFSYGFATANGLISRVQVLGKELTAGAPIPDLALAEEIDRTFSPYLARNEREARVRVEVADPARVVILSEGSYRSREGKAFPLRYSIRYEVFIDGVTMIEVNNTAIDACKFRWLTLSAGAVPQSLAKFLSWMPDLALSQSTRYRFRPLSDAAEQKLLAGTFIPWFWIGDETAGLEVTTWSADSQTYNQVDGTSRGDQSEMFQLQREGNRVHWENFLVRNVTTYAKKGWKRGGEFALAVTPTKKFDPYYAMFKGAHMGPHQHVPKFRTLEEQDVLRLARNGYNLVVGMANWRSGEYVPLNEEDLRRTIALCHKHGIKVIPYITLVDLSQATEAFREHGEEWTIEPTTENFRLTSKFRDPAVEMAYRSDPEQETMLMCPGAAGWREFWKRQIDRIVDSYDFDGLYVDFWFGRLACENTRHGCGGRFRRHTILGAREMLVYAHNRIRAKNPHAILKANTNLLSTALLTSAIDLRLVGESTDITKLDSHTRQWLYSSYRLGEPTEILWAQSRWNDVEKASFAALINFLPQYYARPRNITQRVYDDFDVFRFFEAAEGKWNLGMIGASPLKLDDPNVIVNVVERPGQMLATLVNTTAAAVTARFPARPGQLVYDPIGERVIPAARGLAQVELPAGVHRTFVVKARPEKPEVLFALGARRVVSEVWGSGSRRLRFAIAAPPGAAIRFAVYAPSPVRRIENARGEQVKFTQEAGSNLALFQAAADEGDHFDVVF